MTMTARVTVTSVDQGDDDSPTVIKAEAKLDEKVANPAAGTYEGAPAELDAIYSNTEGKVTRVSVEFEIAGPTKVAEGDLIQLSGHFQS